MDKGIENIDDIMQRNYERREKLLKVLVDDVDENDTKTLIKNARLANEIMKAQEDSSLTKRKIAADEKVADALSAGVANLLTGDILGHIGVYTSEEEIARKLETIDVNAIPTEDFVEGEDELEAEPLDPKKLLEEI